MEEAIRTAVDFVVPVVEAIGATVIIVGVLVSFAAYVLSELRIRPAPYEQVRLQLGRFLALGLEFQLASDILSTAVSPSFADRQAGGHRHDPDRPQLLPGSGASAGARVRADTARARR
ncbi:MAG: hypothetical protein AVDCRST_MAG45-379 [uncultured Solirubrobacterales bacterium]|uniref:Uncharacterized protein n=1 Tax=uncultured Solirubrobacterales bacterium TaxID=768556 RepID=A0A6J4RY62_9ACTN|nr:MAG: hypothetical protein AVDCRST_MAG45-379 [uncultured Solirubrobacterales bacterium]